jgi:hypothetical protein
MRRSTGRLLGVGSLRRLKRIVCLGRLKEELSSEVA